MGGSDALESEEAAPGVSLAGVILHVGQGRHVDVQGARAEETLAEEGACRGALAEETP